MITKVENDKLNKLNIQGPSQQALKSFAIKLIELKNVLESRGESNDRAA